MSNEQTQQTQREMTPYLATGLAEGFESGTIDEVIAAWQYLVDTGLAWRLQGAFGRQAAAMINDGLIFPADVL